MRHTQREPRLINIFIPGWVRFRLRFELIISVLVFKQTCLRFKTQCGWTVQKYIVFIRFKEAIMNWYLVLDQIMDDNIGICPAVNHKSSMLSRVVIYLVFPFVFSMCHVSFKLAWHIVILVTLYKFFFSFLLSLSLSLSLFLISLLLKKKQQLLWKLLP